MRIGKREMVGMRNEVTKQLWDLILDMQGPNTGSEEFINLKATLKKIFS